ncbi:hypothetical protein [Candidatus Palauibacter sp.]|uniref:hypothetical protein n=1 Tax=Candidatus Palauibacter sp. TaxID=3101350 RepID=UPI003B51F835
MSTTRGPKLDAAILSAIAHAESVEGLRVVRVDDLDLLSMSEIATRIGRSRECVRLWVTGARDRVGFRRR